MLLALFGIAAMLIYWRPRQTEGFTVAAVNPALVPACVARSEAAQRILARFGGSDASDTDVEELRLLISKLCCMEADISSPAAGVIRTLPLQFRTSHDMDVASTIVGQCHGAALQERDIDLVIDKFEKRGHELVKRICGGDSGAHADFKEVVERLRWAMMNFCRVPPPNMERPAGPRDPGYYESWASASLEEYKGISASPL